MNITTAFHPSGLTIDFEEEAHTYTDANGKIYESGTSFVGKYFNKFDMDSMSVQCAEGDNPKYTGRSPEDIKAEWQAEGDRGRNEGTNIHLYAEGLMSGWPESELPEPISDRCARIFTQVEIAVEDLLSKYEFIGAEVIVFSPKLGKSGMIDLLMYNRRMNQGLILDYKQNKKITRSNKFQKALKPINHLEETDISKYSLQLSFYEHVLIAENYFPGLSGFHRGLIHLAPDNYEFIGLERYDYEIKQMLKYEGL